jgi:hypothetical protein
MRTAALSAGMALVLLSQPAASQALATRHMPGAGSVNTGLNPHPGGAGPSRFTALGGHTSFGVSPGAVSISTGVARSAAVTAPIGPTVVRGAAAPSLHAVAPSIPPRGGVALGVHAAVPAVPVRGGVGITSNVVSISTGVARSAAVTAPIGPTVVRGAAAPSLPTTAPAAPVGVAAVGTGGGVGPSATGLGSTAGNTVSTGAATSATGSSTAGTSFASTSTSPASTSVLPLPAALRPTNRAVDTTANANQIAGLTLRQLSTIEELERRGRSTRLTSNEREELERLRRENQQLRLGLARAR